MKTIMNTLEFVHQGKLQIQEISGGIVFLYDQFFYKRYN